VGGVEVVGWSSGDLNGGKPKGGNACPPDWGWPPGWPRYGCRGGARSLDQKAVRILSEEVTTTWEVHWLLEILLSTVAQVLSYFEKSVTQKRLIHVCLIIEILAWIQNSSFIDLWTIDVWGQCIARCDGTRKRRWLRRTVRSVPLLQEVIKYLVKQYLYEIGKFAYMKIFYLYHRNDVLHPLLLTLQHFVNLVVPALVGPTGRGTGGRTPLSGIGPMVHHPVA
jgi:hypothetical protein